MVVAVGPVSITEDSCADGALEAASSSESSELKPVCGISEMIGREGWRDVESGPEVDLCFFLGCGSWWSRALLRSNWNWCSDSGGDPWVTRCWCWQG